MLKKIISTIVAKNMKRKLDNATIKEENIRDILYEIRIALLDADVNFLVTKKLIQSIKDEAIGKIVDEDEKLDDVILLIIKDELVKILGKETKEIKWDKKGLKIMMVGLQGSGKTTTCGKLAHRLVSKHQKKPMLVALDIYRPAAIEQLSTLAKQSKSGFYQRGTQETPKTAKEALEFINTNQYDALIFDTAGRLQTNDVLMKELQDIKKNINPDEILLVVDGMSGQDVVNVAKEFHLKLNLTGIIITKLDSDARAGAVLSLTSILNVPIKLTGVGEKITQLDTFHPDRMADRILGLGDMITLAEKAADIIDEKTAKKSLQKMLSGKMDLEDLMKQMEQFQKIGSMDSIVKMMPGEHKISEDKIIQAEKKMITWKVLLNSMTITERRNPNLIKRSPTRKSRIVRGSGKKSDDLNKLLSQWEKSRKRMEEMGKHIKKGNNPFSGSGFM